MKKEIKIKKDKKIKAWIVENGCWATNQMLIYKTRKAAEDRVYNGGMAEVWRVFPCEIKIIL